jgi:hypothetical protein
MTRANRKKSPAPRLPDQLEVVRSVRMDKELETEIDRVRGDIDFSTWCREALKRAVMNHAELVVEDCREYLRHRGVTPDMLMKK